MIGYVKSFWVKFNWVVFVRVTSPSSGQTGLSVLVVNNRRALVRTAVAVVKAPWESGW